MFSPVDNFHNMSTFIGNNYSLNDIESRITFLISQQFNTGLENNLSSTCAQILQQVIKQAIVSSEGGKRLRALLTISAFYAASKETNIQKIHEQSVFDIACALEVFQTAALIHDDIIDESYLRRGKPSAYCALSKVCNNKHIGTGLSLIHI